MNRSTQQQQQPGHLPVMPGESVRGLMLTASDVVVDCTAGGGGHLRLFAEKALRVIGLDRDERAFADDAAGGIARALPNVSLVHAPFSNLEAVMQERGIGPVDAIFADLGVSSFQLDEGERGFSFRADAPLDMRMDTTQGETAAELIASLSADALADVIYRYGEETKSRRIARFIKDRKPTTTGELANAVIAAVGGGGRTHPATRTFQALRIAVNGELSELDTLLKALPRVLKVGGRAGFLTFHSLEDRAVKLAFRGPDFRQTTKKPIVASDDEVEQNPRSRSAKLRVAVFEPDWRSKKKAAYAADHDVFDEDHNDVDDDSADGAANNNDDGAAA